MNQNGLDIGIAAHFQDERGNFRKVWAGSDDTEDLQQGSYREGKLSNSKFNIQEMFTTKVSAEQNSGGKAESGNPGSSLLIGLSAT
jgi:hypothetical protein